MVTVSSMRVSSILKQLKFRFDFRICNLYFDQMFWLLFDWFLIFWALDWILINTMVTFLVAENDFCCRDSSDLALCVLSFSCALPIASLLLYLWSSFIYLSSSYDGWRRRQKCSDWKLLDNCTVLVFPPRESILHTRDNRKILNILYILSSFVNKFKLK